MTEQQLAQVKALADLCNHHDGIELKLNYNTLRERPIGQTNDFFTYVDGELRGFLALYAFNSREAEICGMVHPDDRRQGMFRALLEQGLAELKHRGIPKILLVVDNRSTSGRAFAEAVGATYKVSEYKMHLREPKPQVRRFEDLHVLRAKPEDAEFMAQCMRIAFDIPDLLPASPEKFNQPDRHLYVIRKGSVNVGTMNVAITGTSASIYGFCMLPEQQGRGYGRQALSEVMFRLVEAGITAQDLEVAAENKRALGLYQDCGFVETSSIEYYERSI
ncbi:GNAT family N-acetyltransferase [Tumebacillus permanentifrigoris]|uniref:Acetyltransferase (GNAT) family protein n=1 Tax=Tumebacillus permanentifrigoris TaxID=378543 RepID=A0A316D2W3_9BACL|nr:GNAT family N-acetyltransferase [Tumebacillus permanentifrigoris]PWK05133.1 acetyltransferase (GNAT) family protein [Tumebacillus permanentifrigoris]